MKTSILAAILVSALPLGAKAQEVNSYENYKVGCESGAECNDYNVDYEITETNSDVAQTRRTRRTRNTTSRENKFYAGGNIGFYIPGDNLDSTLYFLALS